MANAKQTPILREMTLYPHSNGPNTAFPSHTYTFRLHDERVSVVLSNERDAPKAEEGPTSWGHHKGILHTLLMVRELVTTEIQKQAAEGIEWPAEAILSELSAPRRLTIIAPSGDGILQVYRYPLAEHAASGWTRKDGNLWGNIGWVTEVYRAAIGNNIIIQCRSPKPGLETTTLKEVQAEGKRRWRVASREALPEEA